MTRELYQPNKYGVILGEGKVGFCTVWSEPEPLIKKTPELRERSALIGTLYSREGANIILRNLALNPDIGYLYLWGHDPLSKKPFGVVGTSILKDIWEKEIDGSGVVRGAKFRIHPEIDLGVLEKVTGNVKLVDISDLTFDESVGVVRQTPETVPYMNSQAFSEHRYEESQPLPSEEVGFITRSEKIFGAWLNVVDRVMRYGRIKETEYGNKQRELINVNWVIEGEDTRNPFSPDLPQEILELIGAKEDLIEQYYPEFMSGELPEGIAYTYGQRLWAWKTADGRQISQIDKIVEHLRESPVTRRAVASTWNQITDADVSMKNPPCFIEMQAIQTEGKLHLLATFRSHDIFKAAVPNAFALRRLQEYLCQQTGFEVGSLSINSHSAHIYEEDWDQAKKTMNCLRWERNVPLVFDADHDTDPRGSVRIRVEGGLIVAELTTADGEVLIPLEGKTARQVSKRLAVLDLLSRPDHMFDIGAELMKAEVAKSLGISYVQDRPLKFK